MPPKVSNTNALKQIVKQALLEVLDEHRDLFHEVFAEVLEDFALGRAMLEGKKTKLVNEAQIRKTLARGRG